MPSKFLTVEIVRAAEAKGRKIPTRVEGATRDLPGVPAEGRTFPTFREAEALVVEILSDPAIPGDDLGAALTVLADEFDAYETDSFELARGSIRPGEPIGSRAPGPIPGTVFYSL